MGVGVFLEKNKQYRSFLLRRKEKVPNLNLYFWELEHEPSGCRIVYIENDDQENLFALSFQTIPDADDGVSHILEHTVLCGSEKFPVRDPFFSMHRRSVHTYMNALTASDFTCYPAASQMKEDFYNLLRVYVDSVFHPKLDYLSFAQEGHRLDFFKNKDGVEKLKIHGIVYNEMKGSLSSIYSYLWHECLARLVPDLPYSFNSGGTPQAIPLLTHEKLKEYHKNHYHPSRCCFYFYGNFPLTDHLDFLEEEVFSNQSAAEKAPPLIKIAKQPRFSKPKRESVPYVFSKEEKEGDLQKKHIFQFSWLTFPLGNQIDLMILLVWDFILMHSDAAPLKKALIESGLCVNAYSSVDSEMTEVPYVITCRGCAEGAGDLLYAVIVQVFQRLLEEGVPKPLVEAAVHHVEFEKTEISDEHGPFGLSLCMRVISSFFHGLDPLDFLLLSRVLHSIEGKIQDQVFLRHFVERYFLENPHSLHLHFYPDDNLSNKWDAQEQDFLNKKEKLLTEEDKAQIKKVNQKLKEWQEKSLSNEVNLLPKISIDQVNKDPINLVLTSCDSSHVKFFHHEAFTNKIVYANLVFAIPPLNLEELLNLQLLVNLWTELGSGERGYLKNLEFIHSHIGDISVLVFFPAHADNPQEVIPVLEIQAKVLHRKLPSLVQLWHDMVYATKFQEGSRLETLLQKLAETMRLHLPQRALHHATKKALSSISLPFYIDYIRLGLPFYQHVQRLSQNSEGLSEKLSALVEKIVQFSQPDCVVSSDREGFESLQKSVLSTFTQTARHKVPVQKEWGINIEVAPSSESEAFIVAAQVACCASACQVSAFTSTNAAALAVGAELLEIVTLHRLIRELGGAYGSGANYNWNRGALLLYSYRDPHINNTLDAFSLAVRKIGAGEFSVEELEAAQLNVIKFLDHPITPGHRGVVAYSQKLTHMNFEKRRLFRKSLLSLTRDDVIFAWKQELAVYNPVNVVFAGKALLERENTSRTKPLKVSSVN